MGDVECRICGHKRAESREAMCGYCVKDTIRKLPRKYKTRTKIVQAKCEPKRSHKNNLLTDQDKEEGNL